jgi:hypothetical protein
MVFVQRQLCHQLLRKSQRGRADWRSAGGVEASSGKEYWDEEEARFASGLRARASATHQKAQDEICSLNPVLRILKL